MTGTWSILAVSLFLVPTFAAPFDPKSSSSFVVPAISYTDFQISYDDNAQLSGSFCNDVVVVGEFSAQAEFGCAMRSTSQGMWPEDGIAGFGQNNASSITIPPPIFYLLSAADESDWGTLPQMFSIWLNASGGELQLGGYDPLSCVGDPTSVPIVNQCLATSCGSTNYQINVDAMYLSTSGFIGGPTVAAVDTGTSCVSLPTPVFQLYQRLANGSNIVQDFIMTIAGVNFTIEFDDLLNANNEICVVENDGNDGTTMTLGTPFFRSLLVTHDLAKSQITLGIAPRNRNYTAVTAAARRGSLYKHPVSRRLNTQSPQTSEQGVELSADANSLEYFIPVQIVLELRSARFQASHACQGTPAQTATLQLDTGSALLAVFVTGLPTTHLWVVILCVVAGFVLLLVCAYVALRLLLRYKKRRNYRPLTSVINN